MESILTSQLWKELRITPGKLEESGRILGKVLWVRAHWRDNTIGKVCWTDRWCTGTIEIFEWGDNLELIRRQTNLLRCLEHSGRINWREAHEQGEHLIQGKEYDQHRKLELSPPEKKRDEECPPRWEFTGWNNWGKTEDTPHEWNRCSRESQTPGRKKGGRAGKTKATREGKSTNILERKHRLKTLNKEGKDFARVGRILDYGLRFRDEKGWAGGKENNWALNSRMKKARIDLSRNAPDEKGWEPTIGKPTTWS